MDKDLLIRILVSTPRVVLPGFGAFLRKTQDEESVFTPFLKGDDGFLISQVQNEYNIGYDDAKEIVYSFVEHIRTILSEKGRYYIEGVGILEIGTNDVITFAMDTSRQIPPAATSAPAHQEHTENQQDNKVVEEVITEGTDDMAKPTVAAYPEQELESTSEVVDSTSNTQTVEPKPTRAVFPPSPGLSPQAKHTFAPRPVQARPVAPSAIPTGSRPAFSPPPKPTSTVPTPTQPRTHQSEDKSTVKQATNSSATAHTSSKTPPRAVRHTNKKRRDDIWLIIAIIAAIIVISIMVFDFVVTSSGESLDAEYTSQLIREGYRLR